MKPNWTDPKHRHGGHPYTAANRLGVSPERITDFSVNTAPTGPPDVLLEHWEALAETVDRYPDRHGSGIREFITDQLNLPDDHVLGGNGVSELLYLVMHALRPDRTALLSPSFHDYRRAAQAAGSTVTSIDIPSNRTAAHISTPPSLQNETDADLLIVGQPNNPTGTVLAPDVIQDVAKQNPDRWVVVDEAFVRFTDQPSEWSVAQDVRRHDNLIVFRSLTKFYTIPGLRAGAVIASPSVLSKLTRNRAPWMVNSVADQAAKCLKESNHYDQTLRSLIVSERARLQSAYASVDGMKLQPSQANFFLARWTRTDTLDDLLKHLLNKELYVRDARNFNGLSGNWFRFAIRTKPENNRLLNAIQSAPTR